KVLLDDSATVTGFEGVDFVTRYGNPDLTKHDIHIESNSFGRATGLFGFVDSTSTNNTTLNSNINGSGNGSPRAKVTAGPRAPLGDPDDAGLLHDKNGDAQFAKHLAFDVNTTNGNIDVTRPHDVSRRSLAVGSAGESGTTTITPQIDFSSDVTILAGRSPDLEIDGSGNIHRSGNVTVDDSATPGESATKTSGLIKSGTIIVNDILTQDPCAVFFAATNHINGSGGTWEFRDTFDHVLIKNDSGKPLQVNLINVINTTVKPIVDISTTSSRNLTFDIKRTVAPTLIDIESTSASRPSITINGLIENPIGTTRVVNKAGDILSSASRAADPDAPSPLPPGPGSLIRTNILDLEAYAGSIGQDPGDAFGQTPNTNHRVNVDVVDSASVPAPTTFIAARVSGTDGSIYLGHNQFFNGELVQYHKISGTTLGNLTDNDYYYVIAVDALHIQLAHVSDPTTPITIDLSGTSPTDQHSLTAAQRFTVIATGTGAQGFAYLDVRGREREDGAYSVVID